MSNEIEHAGEDFDMKPEISKDPVKKLHAKPAIPIEEVPVEDRASKTLAQAIIGSGVNLAELAALIKKELSRDAAVQFVPRNKITVTDFSSLTQDDIYNMSENIEARPFLSGDPLKVVLKDTNYEPRWVNKKSERLGYMLSIGFTYVVVADLQKDLEVEIKGDAEGHFSFGDVVLMRVPKATYYPALKAAHQRAQLVVNSKEAAKNGAISANNYMSTAKDDFGGSVGEQFSEASRNKTLEFYTPNQQ